MNPLEGNKDTLFELECLNWGNDLESPYTYVFYFVEQGVVTVLAENLESNVYETYFEVSESVVYTLHCRAYDSYGEESEESNGVDITITLQ